MNAIPPKDRDNPVAKTIDWDDYRDHLATADKSGRRRWIFPKKPHGFWTTRRTWFSWLLLAVMFIGPFIRINGNPLLLVNIVERRFSVLGQLFWPQDAVVLAVATLLLLTSIVLFTTAFGRLWCGWACPQTVMMEMVFRKIEYWIDGDALEQRQLAAAPWAGQKIFKRALKLVVFYALSFLIGNILLAYIIGSDPLIQIITDDPRKHLVGLTFMILFSLLFFAIFARFREQACTFICPYGRFQSVMLDENSLVVAYDHQRGEKRAHLGSRKGGGYGDCVDCHQCVAVCPTGIDIRNGLQMECVHCTACMDACDAVMDKTGTARGLIRYASANSIERREKFHFTARMRLYSVVLGVLGALFLVLLFTRPAVEVIYLRAAGSLFTQTADGKIQNLYAVRLVNKTMRPMPVEMKLDNLPGQLTVLGSTNLVVPAGKSMETSVLVELDPAVLTGTATKLRVGVYSDGKKLATVKTGFGGPRN